MSNSEKPTGFDLGNIMQIAQRLQGDMARAQEDLANRTCEASSGGGMVTATVNGNFELVSITIENTAVDPRDPQLLQDLVVAAVNQAITKVREMTQSEMSKLTGTLNIPGFPGGIPGL